MDKETRERREKLLHILSVFDTDGNFHPDECADAIEALFVVREVSETGEGLSLEHVLDNASDALRMAANVLESRNRETAMDRQIEYAERAVNWYKDGRKGKHPNWIPERES